MIEKFSTFVMSETTLNQIKALPPEIQLKFFWAVANYGLDGIEPDFNGIELAVWIPMRDLILHSKRKDERWHQKQKENGKLGGRPKTRNNPENPEEPTETQNNPDDVWVNFETHNDNDNDNYKDNDNEFTAPPADSADPKSFPTAKAVEQKEPAIIQDTTALIPVQPHPPPKKSGKTELTSEQLALFHAAKTCFESNEMTKAIIYQDKETTPREMKNIKTLVIRCRNMVPEMTADFLRNVLEHFEVMTNGKLKGRVAFTPRALITPWIWELVIDSLPKNKVTPELRESIRGLFK